MVCPLDWGLGHAARCVPIVRQLLKEGHQVVIGADQGPLAFLKKEFPALEFIVFPGYEVTYSKRGSSFKLFCEGVKFYQFIKKEKEFFDRLQHEHHFDRVISDNRYGVYNDQIESVIITHQIYPKTPLAMGIAHKAIGKLLDRFDEVWIPDYTGEPNLSGDLAHLRPYPKKHQFLGPLSRFELVSNKPEEVYDLCAIVSGPEPQRSIFEQLIIEQIKANELKAVVVRGLPNKQQNPEGLVFNHLETSQLQDYMLKSKMVICRSGYSSIMDLKVLGKKAILVPTPGQSEQEYLAKYHTDNDQFIIQKQEELNLKGLF